MTRSIRSVCRLILLVVPFAGCASAGASGEALEPAPILEERELGTCTYERLGTIQEESRTGLVRETEDEVRRAIGLRARRMGADAVIEFRSMTVTPTATAGGRTTSQSRSEGVAIRFTSATCPRT
jgi:uncharacterized protein YbjQ (UPF0145 family)